MRAAGTGFERRQMTSDTHLHIGNVIAQVKLVLVAASKEEITLSHIKKVDREIFRQQGHHIFEVKK